MQIGLGIGLGLRIGLGLGLGLNIAACLGLSFEESQNLGIFSRNLRNFYFAGDVRVAGNWGTYIFENSTKNSKNLGPISYR